MRFIYPAIFSRKPDGMWHAEFPDLAMCEAEGHSLDDAIRNATSAAYDWIDLELHEDEPDMPPATDPRDIKTGEGEIVRRILVIYRILEGWDE